MGPKTFGNIRIMKVNIPKKFVTKQFCGQSIFDQKSFEICVKQTD